MRCTRFGFLFISSIEIGVSAFHCVSLIIVQKLLKLIINIFVNLLPRTVVRYFDHKDSFSPFELYNFSRA